MKFVEASLSFQDHPGWPLIIIGMMLIIFSVRQSRKKRREEEREKERDNQGSDQNHPKPWL
jgi:hypothetical protein